ncbi:hypothetical protein MLD38_020438 [Melastoma candidum]|uniref:Uncharacterized protein n=1 Tax=Melastoma candidum TaxID=119954 RepID=A0ACB9QD27_9MYRT|nr:hypothetical protein MLD38_020438 [Melastoma candidum]
MACLLYGIINFFVVFLLLLPSCVVVVAYDGTFKLRIWSGKLYQIESNYQKALEEEIKDDLALNTLQSPAMNYYCQKTELSTYMYDNDVTLYGHGVCTSSLSPQNCRDCIVYAYLEMKKVCIHSVGTQIQLMDCRLRYENYKFNNDG